MFPVGKGNIKNLDCVKRTSVASTRLQVLYMCKDTFVCSHQLDCVWVWIESAFRTNQPKQQFSLLSAPWIRFLSERGTMDRSVLNKYWRIRANLFNCFISSPHMVAHCNLLSSFLGNLRIKNFSVIGHATDVYKKFTCGS
jgi:hypothetical protein